MIIISPEDCSIFKFLWVKHFSFSAYQKWATPFNFGVDIQFLRRIFEDSMQASLNLSQEMTSTAAVINNENISLHATRLILIHSFSLLLLLREKKNCEIISFFRFTSKKNVPHMRLSKQFFFCYLLPVKM